MLIRPVGTELFHADIYVYTEGRRDMAKLVVAFRNFSKAPKMKHEFNHCTLPVRLPVCEVTVH
jgi:hypothetical protein